MLADVDPSETTRAEKWQKMGRAQNTVKRGGFWPDREVAGRGSGPSLLRRGEKLPYGYATARGRMGKHHGSEGRRSIKIAPQLPNVTFETHRK